MNWLVVWGAAVFAMLIAGAVMGDWVFVGVVAAVAAIGLSLRWLSGKRRGDLR